MGDEFYVVGGTMRPEASSYVNRGADRELFERVLAGDFCYVLTPRQMGKSSLMIRTAERLRGHQVSPVFVDLSLLGTEQGARSAERWYYSVAREIARGLKLKGDLRAWWEGRADLTAVQCLVEFFQEVVLAGAPGRVVIFVDEIDTTIGLPFTDDFFAAIRACHNSRAARREFERLAFVLLGVASPSDLIKDPQRTPFNVGRRINLTDFLFEEARPLARGLSAAAEDGERILRRVLRWTGGHPYLTQKLCQLAAEEVKGDRPKVDVERLAEKHFLSPEVFGEESNLSFVRDRLTRDKELSLDILEVYRRIMQGEEVTDNPLSPVHAALKLSGLVVPDEYQRLRVRNRIYECVFTAEWADREHAKLSESLHAYKELSQDLMALIGEVGLALLPPASEEEILRGVISQVFKAVPADRCLILRNYPGGGLEVAASGERDGPGEVSGVDVSEAVIKEVMIRRRSVLTTDTRRAPGVGGSGAVATQQRRSVLAVPLGVGERIVGMIYADAPLATSRLTEGDLKSLTAVASAAAIRIENANSNEVRLDQERFERELQLAREIQQRFLPAAPPSVAGYQLQGVSFPASEVGGDYYDFILRPNGRLAVALGDVSGKGTSAALLMSSLHAAVHAEMATGHSAKEVIEAINKYLAENIPANRFVTLFYAELDPATGSLVFVNAGHNPGLVARAAGTVEQLGVGGLPLGIIPGSDYREGRTQLLPGDVFVIYSDGLSESINQQGEEFGSARLQQAVTQSLGRSAAGIRDQIEAALSKFAQGAPAYDDITLVIVKREPA